MEVLVPPNPPVNALLLVLRCVSGFFVFLSEMSSSKKQMLSPSEVTRGRGGVNVEERSVF